MEREQTIKLVSDILSDFNVKVKMPKQPGQSACHIKIYDLKQLVNHVPNLMRDASRVLELEQQLQGKQDEINNLRQQVTNAHVQARWNHEEAGWNHEERNMLLEPYKKLIEKQCLNVRAMVGKHRAILDGPTNPNDPAEKGRAFDEVTKEHSLEWNENLREID